MRQDQTDKVRAFLAEIGEVCRKHQLVLTVSLYDNFQVWPFDVADIGHILNAEDRTTDAPGGTK